MLNAINVKYWKIVHTSENLGYEKENDFAARCDICGDSKDSKKKRLHLYKKDSYESDSIKCFNCGYTGTMYSYLKQFHTGVFNNYMNETKKESFESLLVPEINIQTVAKSKPDLFLFSAPEEAISVFSSKKALNYLNERCITPRENWYFISGKLNLGGKEIHLDDFIVIPLLKNKMWYGFYSRSIKSKIFYTYIPSINNGNKLWNWFDINKREGVYIFESIFDAISSSLDNCVACLGSDIPTDKEALLSKPIFCFDNDSTGIAKALKYALLGKDVFVWDRNSIYKDINEMLVAGINTKEYITNRIYSGPSAVIRLKTR